MTIRSSFILLFYSLVLFGQDTLM